MQLVLVHTIISLICLHAFVLLISAQLRAERVCATIRFEDQCSQLQRGNSDVNCQRVQDSIDCAQRLRNATAEFGVFSAESALLLATLRWDGLTVLKELRHRDRLHYDADYQSVVVVHSSHANGIAGLKGLNFCHPGLFYDRTERWTERFLKHFERNVVTPQCDDKDLWSPAEIETDALAQLFKQACRPGAWSNNIQEDARLKKKYPQLCELCTSLNNTCDYSNDYENGLILSRHTHALRCLQNKGHVAYVSLQHAEKFFETEVADVTKFAYLCPNGTLHPVSPGVEPCVWLRQPWPLIVSSSDRSVELARRINGWLQNPSFSVWQTAFKEIISADELVVVDSTIQGPRDAMQPYREVPFGQTLCSTQSTWCTTSAEEKEKCDVVRAAGISSGVYPIIECRDPAGSTLTCLSDISSGRADFTGIDSNFGFIARYPYNLTTALYAETETEKYASVVVVIPANSSIERFENMRGKKACIAEFGSIASVAFINTGKNRGFFSRNQCHYGHLLSEFFGSSCAPGALDLAHHPQAKLESLCLLCRSSKIGIGAGATIVEYNTSPPLIRDVEMISNSQLFENINIETNAENQNVFPMIDEKKILNCNADESNSFYGNQGALKCMHEEGELAILELQYLKDHANALGINPNEYRILCRNGTLADRTGFDVDQDCALTTIVDGEIVVARNNRKTPGILNALSSFDKYFQSDPDFKMYNSFGGKRDLLFKDSTLGLVARNEENLGQNVENYKKLFENLDACVDGNYASGSAAASLVLMITSITIASVTRII